MIHGAGAMAPGGHRGPGLLCIDNKKRIMYCLNTTKVLVQTYQESEGAPVWTAFGIAIGTVFFCLFVFKPTKGGPTQ